MRAMMARATMTTTEPGQVTVAPSPILHALERRLALELPHISAARGEAHVQRARIAEALTSDSVVPADTAFVVFGSLGRDEWTSGSDLDWALLVDGQADPQHARAIQYIRACLKNLGREPGRTGLFGGLAISHDLVHRIGGEFDTNRNITQRILLILESRNIGVGVDVRERVLRVLLAKYLDDDRGNRAPGDCKPRVPRFLLNDIVRYWRTIAVDFAAKRIDRGGEGWGLRNLKLRMSRKLIFAAGLYACLSCRLKPPAHLDRLRERAADFYAGVAEYLLEYTQLTPLEIVARAVLEYNAESAGKEIFESYDSFLGILRDPEKRDRLHELDANGAFQNDLFTETRPIGKSFETGLQRLFFESDARLTAAAQRYGVF